ncbi:MAG: hypothetical protein CL678_03495 [Bdellovibrionaceae bacterium]|nr:hypothetical protein [Pseudobdellovibrionaceae bacterium]|tara:strand:- start:3295 stop:4422 length:1128 start_codon:yes stop_codon:yes gene_type:complete
MKRFLFLILFSAVRSWANCPEIFKLSDYHGVAGGVLTSAVEIEDDQVIFYEAAGMDYFFVGGGASLEAANSREVSFALTGRVFGVELSKALLFDWHGNKRHRDIETYALPLNLHSLNEAIFYFNLDHDLHPGDEAFLNYRFFSHRSRHYKGRPHLERKVFLKKFAYEKKIPLDDRGNLKIHDLNYHGAILVFPDEIINRSSRIARFFYEWISWLEKKYSGGMLSSKVHRSIGGLSQMLFQETVSYFDEYLGNLGSAMFIYLYQSDYHFKRNDDFTRADALLEFAQAVSFSGNDPFDWIQTVLTDREVFLTTRDEFELYNFLQEYLESLSVEQQKFFFEDNFEPLKGLSQKESLIFLFKKLNKIRSLLKDEIIVIH